MTLHIMSLNMFKLRRLPKRRHVPIQRPQPPMDGWVPATDIADVAFEMRDVHGVEADDCYVQTDICFGDRGAEVVGSGVRGEVRFGFGEVGEEGVDGGGVGGLGFGEAAFATCGFR